MISSPRIMTSPRAVPLALAVGVFAFASLCIGRAHAADLEEITISTPRVKTVGHDAATGAPIQVVTQSAHIGIDPTMFTTNSGVALVHDSVRDTARKICYSLDPLNTDDSDCVREAVKSAAAQIDAAVARAKSKNALAGN